MTADASLMHNQSIDELMDGETSRNIKNEKSTNGVISPSG
jgi:hypothetical protein